jgi:hypothetical protein
MHKHKWIVTKQETLPSAWEQLDKNLTDLKTRGYDLFSKDVIVNYRCESCGTEKVERI